MSSEALPSPRDKNTKEDEPFDGSRVTLAAPNPMPHLDNSLGLATLFSFVCGLFFDLSRRFRSNKTCSVLAASSIAEIISDGFLAKKDEKLRISGVQEV